jgi:hypothetical protein
MIGCNRAKQSFKGRRVYLRKTTIVVSSPSFRTVETGCLGPIASSDVVRRPLHFAIVLGLSASRRASALLDSTLCCISRRIFGVVLALRWRFRVMDVTPEA